MLSLPDLLLPKNRYFGLSIDRAALRAIELDQHGGVRAIAELTFPNEIFSEGTLINKDYFIQAIKNLYQAGKFSTPYVIVCFPEAYAYTRGYTLPKIPLEDVQEAVSWHVKDLFPFPEEEIYYDWRLLNANDTEYQIAVVAVQKKVLDSLVGALVAAGLKPLRFEPDASVIARLLMLKPDQSALVTDVSQRGAYVTLVEGEKATFTTVVNVTADDTPQTYLNNINQALVDIELFYKAKGVLKATSLPVILTGELATDEWAKEAASVINHPMKILKTGIQNPLFNKAYAAATARVAPPRDEQTINLLPEHVQATYDSQRQYTFYKTILNRTNIFVACLCLVSIASFLAVSLTKQQLDASVKTLTTSAKAQGPEIQNLLLLNAQAKQIVALAPLRTTPRDNIVAIAAQLLEGINITQWEYDDSKLLYSLTGTAKTRDDLIQFKEKLEQSGLFANVTLPLGSLERPINARFVITFIFKK